MDCQMPVMDGYEATKCIRDPQSKVRDHEVPVIAMTANAIVGDREVSLAAGMNDHLTKPVNLGRLRSALERWLPTRCQSRSEHPREEAPGNRASRNRASTYPRR